jgi:DNA polymerase III subunit alpha
MVSPVASPPAPASNPRNPPAFVHLRLHSEYSVTDSVVRIDAAVAAAAADSMPALALTDLSNLFGMVKFYQAAREAGVKPIVGCDVWIENEADREQPFRLLLLVKDHGGYLKLCDLLTRAWLENQHRGRAELKKSWLREGATGLIALSAAQAGDIGHALATDNLRAAETLAQEWGAMFPGAFYIELQRAAAPQGESLVARSVELASRTGLPVVATHPIQFLTAAEFRAHEARVCIAEGHILGDTRRPRRYTPEQYFRSQAEMAELFKDLPEALANAVEIAKRCNLQIELGKNKLPHFPTPEGVTLDDHLRALAAQGLQTRMAALYPDAAARERELPKYSQRLDFETATIIQMGFAGYFLIVADFINWAKRHDVPVGPGRGSGAGSLVAYALGITDLDPLQYDLLFERFLNPERVSMPDFDIDFCQDGRERVIEYVKQKYGAASVSQIATFGTMAAKAVVRDVGRVIDWGYSRTDELAKLIPFQPGKLITLKMAREMEPRLREREEADEETRELLALAEQLEGLTRNVGMHAGGVLIAPGKLTDFCPLYAAGGAETTISQFDKDDVEAVGLVKFDFLGLTTLTILDWTLRFIKLLDPTSQIRLETLPLDDEAAFRIMKDANSIGVFQFESRGMKDLLARARPDRFEDIIALVALFRPGPMELIPEYIDRKHGARVDFLDPRLEPILAPTYGIMVYQEQVMQIAQVIGGYSLGSADLLRRAMGKKKPEEMALQREVFVAGAIANRLDERRAQELFDLMEKFAGYGFNKSHAAAYALLAYQTAYFKARHPAPFMAANLSALMDDTDRVRQFCEDAKANGLTLLPPDINVSGYRFIPVDGKTIRYGLGAIKGTGASAIAEIVRVREAGGGYSDLFDFCHRIDRHIVNRRVVEALVRAGAFDSLGSQAQRASLLASVGIALEAAEQAARDAQQVSLFGAEDIAASRPQLVAAATWTERERLLAEKACLGFFLSGHLFNSCKAEVASFVRGNLAQLHSARETQVIAGMIVSTRIQNTRRGKMAVVLLDDGSAQVEVSIFNEQFEANRDILKDDELLVVQGKVSRDEFSGGLRVVADKLLNLTAARSQFARAMRLNLNGEGPNAANANKLKTLLAPYRDGGIRVMVCYRNGDAECELPLGDAWKVRLDDGLVTSLREWLQPENVQVLYS